MQESIYSKNIKAGSKTYFFDIRITKSGQKYLHITESRLENTEKIRNSIVIFDDHIDEFYNIFEEVKKKISK